MSSRQTLIPCPDGKSLTFALEKEISKIFLELAMLCKAVICCESLVQPPSPGF